MLSSNQSSCRSYWLLGLGGFYFWPWHHTLINTKFAADSLIPHTTHHSINEAQQTYLSSQGLFSNFTIIILFQVTITLAPITSIPVLAHTPLLNRMTLIKTYIQSCHSPALYPQWLDPVLKIKAKVLAAACKAPCYLALQLSFSAPPTQDLSAASQTRRAYAHLRAFALGVSYDCKALTAFLYLAPSW